MIFLLDFNNVTNSVNVGGDVLTANKLTLHQDEIS